MKIEKLQNKKILILGYGKEGQAAERFLKVKVPSAQIIIADQKDGPHYLDKQNDCDIVIKSPGIHKDLVTAPYTTGTSIFFSNISNVTIGITGSKGKSTTTSLIYHILKEAGKTAHLVGNIGNPMLDELLKPIEPDDIFVCELSSYQLDNICCSPHISVVLNLFPEHMNYHGSVAAYYEAKHRIINNVKPEDYFIYNSKTPELVQWAEKASCHVLPFVDESEIADIKIPLLGDHNKMNVRAAITAVKLFNISHDVIKHAIESFQPLSHRLELVGTFDDISFYDDAISTTPESTIEGIKALKNVSTIFLGGEDRGYDFTDLINVIKEYKIQNIVLFPHSGAKIFELLSPHVIPDPDPGSPVSRDSRFHGNDNVRELNILQTTSMEEAVKFAYQNSPKGSICLLSTASPSYSLWKNFEEKGDQFQHFVKQLHHV